MLKQPRTWEYITFVAEYLIEDNFILSISRKKEKQVFPWSPKRGQRSHCDYLFFKD